MIFAYYMHKFCWNCTINIKCKELQPICLHNIEYNIVEINCLIMIGQGVHIPNLHLSPSPAARSHEAHQLCPALLICWTRREWSQCLPEGPEINEISVTYNTSVFSSLPTVCGCCGHNIIFPYKIATFSSTLQFFSCKQSNLLVQLYFRSIIVWWYFCRWYFWKR